MRKIIFEQICNLVMTFLYTYSFCYTLLTSNIQSISKGVTIHLGLPWLITIGMTFIFLFLRLYYQRILGKNDGYNEKKGELSFEDERERLIGSKSSMIAYRSIPYILMIAMITMFFSPFVLTSVQYISVVSIVSIGICLSSFFIIYTISWLLLDSKI